MRTGAWRPQPSRVASSACGLMISERRHSRETIVGNALKLAVASSRKRRWGTRQVSLEGKAARREAHQIRSEMNHVAASRNLEPAHLSPEMPATAHSSRGTTPSSRFSIVVMSCRKRVQRGDSLRESLLDLRPP